MVKITRADRISATDYILHEIEHGRAVISRIKEGKTAKPVKLKRQIELADDGTMYVYINGQNIPLDSMRSADIIRRQYYNPSEYRVIIESSHYWADKEKRFDSLKEARKFAYSIVYGQKRARAGIRGPNNFREDIRYDTEPDGTPVVFAENFKRWVPITCDGRALTSKQVIFN